MFDLSFSTALTCAQLMDGKMNFAKEAAIKSDEKFPTDRAMVNLTDNSLLTNSTRQWR